MLSIIVDTTPALTFLSDNNLKLIQTGQIDLASQFPHWEQYAL